MKLTNYIQDLLYRYECVIIPGFGGFISQYQGASFLKEKQVFIPPFKKISFNSQLKDNDGLLANYISKKESKSYVEVLDFIDTQVTSWKDILLSDRVLPISGVGLIALNAENKMVFSPYDSINYDTASYGLSEVFVEKITKTAVLEVSETKSNTKRPVYLDSGKRTNKSYGKMAFTAVALIGLSFLWNGGSIPNDLITTASPSLNENRKEEIITHQAGFIIPEALPKLKVTVKSVDTPYHIIAGAFRDEVNALKKVDELKKLGFKAKMIGKNKFNLYQVTYGSFQSESKANEFLREVRRTKEKDAWLLKK